MNKEKIFKSIDKSIEIVTLTFCFAWFYITLIDLTLNGFTMTINMNKYYEGWIEFFLFLIMFPFGIKGVINLWKN